MAHPVLMALVKARARQQLRASGHTFLESLQLAATVDDALVQTAADAGSIEVPLAPPATAAAAVGVLGDGSIIKFFMDFLNSDLGKALISLLMKLLLGGL